MATFLLLHKMMTTLTLLLPWTMDLDLTAILPTQLCSTMACGSCIAALVPGWPTKSTPASFRQQMFLGATRVRFGAMRLVSPCPSFYCYYLTNCFSGGGEEKGGKNER
jgi:hypothetical protein